jgi:hypothetical protein
MSNILSEFTLPEISKAGHRLKKITDNELAKYKLGDPREQREAQAVGVLLLAGHELIIKEMQRRTLEGKTEEQKAKMLEIYSDVFSGELCDRYPGPV